MSKIPRGQITLPSRPDLRSASGGFSAGGSQVHSVSALAPARTLPGSLGSARRLTILVLSL